MARTTISYIKSRFESGDRPTEQDYLDLIDTLSSQATDLGSAGNNEMVVDGIENETAIDSFPASEWRMVKYLVSLSKVIDGANKFYTTEFSILIDQEHLNVSEYGIIDNDGDIGTISVTQVSGTVRLIVTPNPSVSPITARFARIGLKS
jgi:hypothetical protein